MAKAKPYYMVLRRGARTHYVLATRRKFWLYSEAELYVLNIDLSREPIILLID